MPVGPRAGKRKRASDSERAEGLVKDSINEVSYHSNRGIDVMEGRFTGSRGRWCHSWTRDDAQRSPDPPRLLL